MVTPKQQGDALDVRPNIKLVWSLRDTGYKNEEAIGDIADNSLESALGTTLLNINIIAGASESSKKGQSNSRNIAAIVIADNGAGMTRSVLEDAMRMGSTGADATYASDLGLYGMGLKTAATSLGRRFTIVTKNKEDEYLFVVYDIDKLIENGDFFIDPIRAATDEEVEHFLLHTENASQGTVVTIDKVDRITSPNVKVLKNTIKSYLGQIFRVFIHDGVVFKVNGEPVLLHDPFDFEELGTADIRLDESFEVIDKETDKPFTVRVRLGLVPPMTTPDARKHHIGRRTQGFYVMRNGRQIQAGGWLGIPNRAKSGEADADSTELREHSDRNRIRGEISFTGDADKPFGVTFTKTKVDLEQSLKDVISTKVSATIKAMEGEAKAQLAQQRAASTAENEEENRKLKDSIEKKGVNRIKQGKVTEPDPLPSRGSRGRSSTGSKAAGAPEPVPTRETRELVEIKQDAFGPHYDVCSYEYLPNGVLRITWNTSHPFYANFLARAQLSTKEIVNKVFFALGRAQWDEFDIVSDENKLNDLNSTMSKHLAKLMD